MRPGIRRNLLWMVPFAVLALAIVVRLVEPDWTGSVRAATFDILSRLAARTLARPLFADRPEEVFLAAVGLGIVMFSARARTGWAGFLWLAASVAAVAFAVRMAVAEGLFFEIGYPILALGIVFLAGAAVPSFTGVRERARLKQSLDHHLAPAAMAAITRRPELLNLTGETRTMSYLACGIRRYPQLAGSFADDPEGLRRLTQRTLGALSDTVLRYKGVVDRVAPGGLSAFFNAPLEDPEHAVHACECALAMTRALESINHALEQERRGDGSPHGPIEVGVGVHTGPGVVGDFGTGARPEYTVAGPAIELAREIELASAKYGPAVIVTDDTRKLAERNFAFLEVDTIVTPNAPSLVNLYALLGNPLFRASPKFRALATFHDHIFQAYRAREWAKARALIEQCRALSGASAQLYDLYLSRIAYYSAHPPDPNWSGAVRAPVT